jgi:pilus assembly protein TadC
MSAARVAAACAALAAILCVASLATATTGTIVERLPLPDTAARLARLRGFVGALARSRLGRLIRRERLRDRIDAARCSWTADEIAGTKMVGAAGALVCLFAPAPLPLVAVPIALVAFRLPDVVVSRAARRRRAAASREVPLFLDLLAVATSAGLAPQLAVHVSVGEVRGPLGDELRHALGLADLGRRWRDELSAAAERLALPELRRAVAIVRRSETLGGSTAGEIARLAFDVRSERRSRAAERARTAPVKMLFPLVFLILPAFLLLTVVPVLLTTVRSIH